MDPERFQELVEEAVAKLPKAFADRLENVDVVVERAPTRRVLRKMGLRGRRSLLGLYEGVPHTRRTHDYGFVLPDRIVIYREPVLAAAEECREPGQTLDEAVCEQVRRTVLHEIGHHFGLDEGDLERLDY